MFVKAYCAGWGSMSVDLLRDLQERPYEVDSPEAAVAAWRDRYGNDRCRVIGRDDRSYLVESTEPCRYASLGLVFNDRAITNVGNEHEAREVLKCLYGQSTEWAFALEGSVLTAQQVG